MFSHVEFFMKYSNQVMCKIELEYILKKLLKPTPAFVAFIGLIKA